MTHKPFHEGHARPEAENWSSTSMAKKMLATYERLLKS